MATAMERLRGTVKADQTFAPMLMTSKTLRAIGKVADAAATTGEGSRAMNAMSEQRLKMAIARRVNRLKKTSRKLLMPQMNTTVTIMGGICVVAWSTA